MKKYVHNARVLADLTIMCGTKCNILDRAKKAKAFLKNIKELSQIFLFFSFRECRARKKLRYQVNRTFSLKRTNQRFQIIRTLETQNHMQHVTSLKLNFFSMWMTSSPQENKQMTN